MQIILKMLKYESFTICYKIQNKYFYVSIDNLSFIITIVKQSGVIFMQSIKCISKI